MLWEKLNAIEVMEDFIMRELIRLTDYSKSDIYEIFEIADDLLKGKYKNFFIRDNFIKDKFLFCGENKNIGYAWKEASEVMGFDLEQCCGEGYEMEGIVTHHDIEKAILGKDIICTDSLPATMLEHFKKCKVTTQVMKKANKGAVLNPCPPFYRGEEISDDIIESEFFVGYEFKKYLLYVQQAIMMYCLVR